LRFNSYSRFWFSGSIGGSCCGTATIQRIEKSDSPITGYVSTVMRIEAAEKAGILFITDDEIAGIGVRLAKKKRGR
jgi:hypothetical protein